MTQHYFVIHNIEGDTTVDMLTEATLRERLDEEYYGSLVFLESIPESDTNYWGEATLIIKGSVCVPQPKEVVKSWEVK